MEAAWGYTLQSIRSVVWSGTGFFSLKLASMVESSGVKTILAISAVLSSSRDSICARGKQPFASPSAHNTLE